jgi:hypothetical protein
LLTSVERATGKSFQIEYVSTYERMKEGRQLIAQADYGPAVGCFSSKLIWGKTGAACFEDGMEFGQGKVKRRDLNDIMLEAIQWTIGLAK